MTDIHDLDAAALAAAYRARALSPVEATRHLIARRDAMEPAIRAFTHVDDDAALAAARASEARWRAGAALGPVDGVPATIKENVAVAGWPSARGSVALESPPYEDDAPATMRLREAGAVLLGQTAMPEFGWKGLGDSPAHGVTRNPYDLARSPGGSSAGAAAAAALGIGVLHIGTDGLGSVRIPCAFTGLPGLKPTSGRVPAWPASPMGLLAILGPMARSLADVALLFELMARPDDRDSLATTEAAPAARAGLEAGVRGLRAAWSPRLGYVVGLDPRIEAACEAALAPLQAAGLAIEARDPGFADPIDLCNVFWHAGSATVLRKIPESRWDMCDPGFLRGAQAGMALPAVRYAEAIAERASFVEAMRRFHERFDFLITPTMPIPAVPIGADLPPGWAHGTDWTSWSPYTYPFNLSGQPAVTVPVGLTEDGLPIGLQIVGRRGEDVRVLATARVIEAAIAYVHPDTPRGMPLA
ncbi:amidase [Salinarimonas sp.]|uniref:amidase n=1 Tax=Salinarimonas sp. TaxID=2766526 RepID=UPI00391AF331